MIHVKGTHEVTNDNLKGGDSFVKPRRLPVSKPMGGHFNAGRKQLIDRGLVSGNNGLTAVSLDGIAAAGSVPPGPQGPEETLELWLAKLKSPAPEMLRAIVAAGRTGILRNTLADQLGKQPRGGHWNSGLSVLRKNELIEAHGDRLRASDLFFGELE